jgi:hypothetical protein
MMVKTNVAPPVPVTDFASAGAVPAPPHYPPPRVAPPNSAGPAVLVIVALAAVLAIGGAAAAILLAAPSSPPEPPPLPPGVTTTPTSVTIGNAPPPTTPAAGTQDPVAAAGIAGMFDARCNAKDAQSCVALGMMYREGQMGLPQDKEKAKTYFAKACSLGDKSACTMMK